VLGVNSIEPGFPFSSPGQLESTPRVNAHVIIFSVPPFRLALSAGGGYTERTMPSLSLPALSRRAFTATVLPVAGALVRAAAPLERWAFLSDTHVPSHPTAEYRGFRPYENTMKVVAQLHQAKPDGALICGDLARLEGQLGDYENLKALLDPLATEVPIAYVLGNHDHRKNFLRVFPRHEGAQQVKDKHVVVLETPTVRFILLDSLFLVNQVAGLLGKAQRLWLAQFLANASARPTLLFVHHTLDDGDGALLDAPRLFDIVQPARMVKAIIYGHSHAYGFRKEGDLDLINIPAVGYNFSDNHPVGWIEARVTREGGEFTLHAIGGDRSRNGETTKLRWRAS